MCAHEIKVRGGFESSYFIDRHFRRERVRGSLVGWNESKNDFIEGLIGFEYEEMESDRTPVHTMESTENKDIVHQSSASMLPTTNQGSGVKLLGKNRSVTFYQLLPVDTTLFPVSNSLKSQILCYSYKIS